MQVPIASLAARYTDQTLDYETELMYYNARYYDPQLGVFTSADSIIPDSDDPLAYNRHMYVRGNPIKYSDPSGHFWWVVPFLIGALIGGIAAGTGGNIAGWVDGSVAFNWDAAWKGALAGGIGTVAGVGGAAFGAAVFGTSTLAGSIATGVSAGFASGFAGSSSGAWLNGANFEQGLKAGLIGGGIGAAIGGTLGGLRYGYDRFLGNQIDKGIPGSGENLSPEQRARIEAYEMQKYGRLRDHTTGLASFSEAQAGSLSWGLAKEAFKISSAVGFLKGFGKSLLFDKRDFGDSLVDGFNQAGQWGLAGFTATYAAITVLTLTAASTASGVITGPLRFSVKLTNPNIWMGAVIGLAYGSAYTAYAGLPFIYQPYARGAYER